MLNFIFSIWIGLIGGGYWFTATTANAGTSANNTGVGSIAWGNVGNAADGLNSTFAQVSSTTPSSISNYLRLSNYGFSIPAGATINGVKVTIRAGSVGDALFLTGACTSPTINYYRVRLVNEASVVGTADKAADNTLTNNGVFADVFGGAVDTWSGDATGINWNNSNSGVVVAFQWTASGSSNCTAVVDYVPIEITYTPAAGSGMPRRTIVSRAGKIERLENGFNFLGDGL